MRIQIPFPIFGFNFNDQFDLQAIVAALDKSRQPGILMLSTAAIEFSGLEYAVHLVTAAKSAVNTPLYLQLDHCREFALMERCASTNFDLIMADFSHEDFETNISLTREAVALAHRHDILVEAEIDVIPTIDSAGEFAQYKAQLTDPEVALEFVRRTEVDMLAVSVGNIHGTFKDKPNLNLDLIAQLRRLLSVPLVLHGSDFLDSNVLRQAFLDGIRKANLGPELREVYRRSLCEQCGDGMPLMDQRPILANVRRSIEKQVSDRLNILVND